MRLDELKEFMERVKGARTFKELKDLCEGNYLARALPTCSGKVNGSATLLLQEKVMKGLLEVEGEPPKELSVFRVVKFLYHVMINKDYEREFKKLKECEKALLCKLLRDLV